MYYIISIKLTSLEYDIIKVQIRDMNNLCKHVLGFTWTIYKANFYYIRIYNYLWFLWTQTGNEDSGGHMFETC